MGLAEFFDGGMGGNSIPILLARICLWIQMIFVIFGSIGYSYAGTHGVTAAVTIYGLLCLQIGTRAVVKLYVFLLLLAIAMDVMFACMWTDKIARNDTEFSGKWNEDKYRDSEKMSMAAVYIGGFVRVLSLPLWCQFWYKAADDSSSGGLTDNLLDP
ncbi:hypothetical protein CYMTET_46471 [Cymbomonas tetramitiformis]|uniref:Uncharacterized protein n=1 Tax=Cymbomonas tetramitiformis TaxID=36881 RepID=A0AAE0EYN2_9CHLO|nr:hypothetical protein CYMTET_46471 [Cymbomonas tetramitiformis]